MPESGNVTLKIYDVLGREVITLVNEELSAGKHDVTFDASQFSSGVYFYQLKAGDFIEIKKMILIK
jgi:flagellar hook assembly protein FlgD